jgi:hypothetical protein
VDVREVAALVRRHVGTVLDSVDLACKQKVRGSSPLAGSQLKAPFPALEGGFC